MVIIVLEVHQVTFPIILHKGFVLENRKQSSQAGANMSFSWKYFTLSGESSNLV